MEKNKCKMEPTQKKIRLILLILIFLLTPLLSKACPLRIDKIDKETLTCKNLDRNDLYCYVFRLEDDYDEKKVENLISIWAESKEIVSRYKFCRFSDDLDDSCIDVIDEFLVKKYDLHMQLLNLVECGGKKTYLNRVGSLTEAILTYGELKSIGVVE